MSQAPGAQRAPGPSGGALALAVEVARRFHVDGASKVAIAQELGINRFKVARLLELARTAGMVQIRIGSPPQVDAALSRALCERLALPHAVVLAGGPEEGPDAEGSEAGPLGQAVGRLAAGYLQQLVGAEDVVGLAWGHAMSALAQGWGDAVPATFVQLAGAIARADVAENAPELVRSTATAAGGTAAVYYAPLLMPDAASAAALRQQTGVREVLGRLDGLTRAVVSIGAWAPGESTVYDCLDPVDRERVRAAGVVGEATGVLFDRAGATVDVLRDRVVAVSEEQLRRTGHVVALAVGSSRAPAVAAVARSGLVTTLVTHSALARALVG